MDISPYYIDARNALTQPEKMVFLSQYFRRCWMPVLGPLGTAVVIYLRGACYHNRKTGETRDSVQISQREIAAGCGCSVPTIKRELERNEALRRFVQISPEWERDGASGRVRQLENHYKIAMDDPLTESDEARLKEMVSERIAQEQRASSDSDKRPRKPIRLRESSKETLQPETDLTACSKVGLASLHDAVPEEVSDAVFTACSKQGSFTARSKRGSSNGQAKVEQEGPPAAQNELLRPVAHFEPTPVQSELLSEESLLKTTPKEQTLNVREPIHFVESQPREEDASPEPTTRNRGGNAHARRIDRAVSNLVTELHDLGSERRHRQLLEICHEHGLEDLSRQALTATRCRLAQETKRGPLGKPGAYYQKILIQKLEEHQVFVPKAGEDDAGEVRRLVRASMGLSRD